MSIRQLSPQLANQIAAGEVVERPASVVKELLENAVDAGATVISCQLENAGRTLIAVQDNGAGIEKSDLPLVFAAHATSKISTLQDLEAIVTLGFRGEALASIAAVSKVRLTSKAIHASEAYAVSCQGDPGKFEILPAAHPCGTTVEVRELFFNTPARRRFLRSDRTEFLRIREVFVRCAIANPQLSFSLVCDGRRVLEVGGVERTGGEEFLKRLGRLAGGDFIASPLKVDYQGQFLTIQGLCLKPPLEHETVPEQIYLFLNGRAIADKLLTHALKEAYVAYGAGRSTVRCVLYLSCDPHVVDVNVHPRKDEVRFHEARVVHDTLVDCILNTLKEAEGDELGRPENLKPVVQGETKDYLSFMQHKSELPDFPDGEGSFSLAQPVRDEGRTGAGSEREKGHSALSDKMPQEPKPEGVSEQNAFLHRVRAENAVLKASLADSISLKTPQQTEILEALPAGRYLVRQEHAYFVLDPSRLDAVLRLEEYAAQLNTGRVTSSRLSIAVGIKLQGRAPKKPAELIPLFAKAGFKVELSSRSLLIKEVPLLLAKASIAPLGEKMLECLMQYGEQILACRAELRCFSALEPYVLPQADIEIESILERAGDLRRLSGHPQALLQLSLKKLSSLLDQD
ncbi:MAG: DNA mismatch repair endonuclease MutL [Succinivibrio sp.]|nr:DNA mismatch repair endonuclease MutL [Succinivibrio sp.]